MIHDDNLTTIVTGDGRNPTLGHTVDGRNPAPVDRWFIPLFTRFYTSQLVEDFFHQQ